MALIEITTRIGCKNMCSYCPQDKIISAYKDKNYIMSLDTYKKCLNKIPKDVLISFSGMVEPFLNSNCIEMIEYAVQEGFKVNIFTTSVGMTKNDIKRLEKIPIDYFEFHLPDDRNNTKIKVDKVFIKNLKLIKKSKISHIHYQVFGKLHPKVKKVLNMELEDLSRLIQTRAGNVEGSRANKLKGQIICKSVGRALNNNVLLPNGDVILCCMDYELKHKFGNLLKDSYEDLFKSKSFYEVQFGMDNDYKDILCRKCDYAMTVNSKKYNFRRFTRQIGLIKFLYFFKKIPVVDQIYIWGINKIRNKQRFAHNVLKEGENE